MIKVIFSQIKNIFRNCHIIKRTNNIDYKIVKLSHQIEKGMVARNFSTKKHWGWNKIDALLNLLDKCSDAYSLNIGISAALAFCNIKKQEEEENLLSKTKELLDQIVEKKKFEQVPFGCKQISKSELMNNMFEQVLVTRHSVRNFSSKDVSYEDIYKAISLARYCPSACNRQPYKVYLLDAERKKNIGLENQINANKYLIITGIISAYSIDEYDDWYVSPSIFAGYLSLSLHYFGIGNCIMRANLNKNTDYNKSIKKELHIPGDEFICLEMAIGYYDDISYVANSYRKSVDEIIGGK